MGTEGEPNGVSAGVGCGAAAVCAEGGKVCSVAIPCVRGATGVSRGAFPCNFAIRAFVPRRSGTAACALMLGGVGFVDEGLFS